MKSVLVILTVASLRFGECAYGQGTIVFNNLGLNEGKVELFDAAGAHTPLNQDLNFSLSTYRAFSSKLERSWLLSDGTAKGINVGPGLFADPTHSVIALEGTVPGQEINVIVSAWAGDYPTVGAAASAGAPAGTTLLFRMTLGNVETPPASLVGFSGLAVGVIPEPGALSLAALGAALYFSNRLLHRPKSNTA